MATAAAIKRQRPSDTFGQRCMLWWGTAVRREPPHLLKSDKYADLTHGGRSILSIMERFAFLYVKYRVAAENTTYSHAVSLLAYYIFQLVHGNYMPQALDVANKYVNGILLHRIAGEGHHFLKLELLNLIELLEKRGNELVDHSLAVLPPLNTEVPTSSFAPLPNNRAYYSLTEPVNNSAAASEPAKLMLPDMGHEAVRANEIDAINNRQWRATAEFRVPGPIVPSPISSFAPLLCVIRDADKVLDVTALDVATLKLENRAWGGTRRQNRKDKKLLVRNRSNRNKLSRRLRK